MSLPIFEYIPILAPSTSVLRVAFIRGLSTRHGVTVSDHGRLYGNISGLSLTLFADVAKSVPVLAGTASASGAYFDLAEQSGSGMSGRAWLSGSATETDITLFPSFADDQDVMLVESAASQMPGWNADYGFAFIHAAAMRTILTTALPAKLPHLFGGRGAAAFVPGMASVALPDLKLLANADLLRIAQADLVKALAARESEHVEQWAEVMKASFERFNATMDALAAANKQEQVAAQTFQAQASGVSIGSWRRG